MRSLTFLNENSWDFTKVLNFLLCMGRACDGGQCSVIYSLIYCIFSEKFNFHIVVNSRALPACNPSAVFAVYIYNITVC